jgi:hypothetical protein
MNMERKRGSGRVLVIYFKYKKKFYGLGTVTAYVP